jgi:hypothetical protein
MKEKTTFLGIRIPVSLKKRMIKHLKHSNKDYSRLYCNLTDITIMGIIMYLNAVEDESKK